MIEPNFELKTEVEKDNYGKFVIEPLEQGYGQTLGNSLRRVLLTSLPGSAINSVKIEGVKHQFSTIAGLKEDVVELTLNIKKIRLTVDNDEDVILTLSKKGPGQVTAGDIEAPAGVTIVNPDLVLGVLSDKKSQLNLTMTASRGFGYVMVEDKVTDELGVIPLDSLYTPITRVNYKVEATRVGRMINLDKLIIELWSDGTIKPIDALYEASRILVSYYTQIFNPKPVVKVEEEEDSDQVPDEILKMRIEELDIPTRIVNALANGGIETVGKLAETPKQDLMKIKNLGTKSLAIVEERIGEKGVKFSS